MSVESLGARELAALVFGPDTGLAGKLVVGDIVHGSVLRHVTGERYLVRFLGREHTVQSRSPLEVQESFRGRVVRVGEQIELERLDGARPAPASGASAANEPWLAISGSAAAQLIEELFRRHRASLDVRDAVELRRAVARAARPDRMALAGLVLAKSGLPLAADWLDSLYRVFDAPAGALGPVARRNDWPPAQWVLNRQTGGAVAHEAGRLDVETAHAVHAADAAFFDEHGEDLPAGTEHRKFVLTLAVEHLGRIELRAVLAGEHIRIALATERTQSTQALRDEAASLSRALADAGWRVDEISHETRALGDGSAVGAALAEHVITPGSVSRLL